jgi:hypothetical protein
MLQIHDAGDSAPPIKAISTWEFEGEQQDLEVRIYTTQRHDVPSRLKVQV